MKTSLPKAKDGYVHDGTKLNDTAVQNAASAVIKSTIDTPVSSLEDDIAWCVTQLEMNIGGKAVTKQQKEEMLKYIKLLQSSKTPVPRKRQIMRQSFGDYKQKMKERPLPSASSKLTIPDCKHISSAGNFHRKSTKLLTRSVEDTSIDDKLSPDHTASQSLSGLCKELESASFTFDFSID